MGKGMEELKGEKEAVKERVQELMWVTLRAAEVREEEVKGQGEEK